MAKRMIVAIALVVVTLLTGNFLLTTDSQAAGKESSGIIKGDKEIFEGTVSKMANLIDLSGNVAFFSIELLEFPGKRFAIPLEEAVKFGIVKKLPGGKGQITVLEGKKVSLTCDKNRSPSDTLITVKDFKLN